MTNIINNSKILLMPSKDKASKKLMVLQAALQLKDLTKTCPWTCPVVAVNAMIKQ
jgi:hypothetical protein